MLSIHYFTFNPFAENTYVIYNEEGEAIIVDPGMMQVHEQFKLQQFIQDKNLTVTKIINTHAHIDHVMGVKFIKDWYKVKFYLHKDEMPVLHQAVYSAEMFGLKFNEIPEVDGYIDEQTEIVLGKDRMQVLFTPGHSPGSISFYAPEFKWIIAGDVLFNGSIGRTDLPGGSITVLEKSIQEKLYTLPDDVVVYPGHGEPTTIGREKTSNPFVRVS